MSTSHLLAGAARPALAGVPHDLYRLARRYRQARWADLLGRPRSERAILDGHFPIPPERVLYLDDAPSDVEPYADEARGLLNRAKVHAVVRVMARLAAGYDAALARPWTSALLRREALGSCGVGGGFALVHQFQGRAAVAVSQRPVDWWLILSPRGIDWEGIDGRPVHGMFAHVFAEPDRPGLRLRVYEKACRLGREIDWAALASRPAIDAAATVNRRLLEMTV